MQVSNPNTCELLKSMPSQATINALLTTFSIRIFHLLFGQMFVPPNNVLFYSRFINKISDTLFLKPPFLSSDYVVSTKKSN